MDRPLEHEITLLMQTSRAFIDAMQRKLIHKAADGESGWDDPESIPEIKRRLLDHVNRGDGQEVDVANLAMMLWYHNRHRNTGKR